MLVLLRTVGSISAAILLWSYSCIAYAAEIKMLGGLGMKAAIEDVALQFQRATGHKVLVNFLPMGATVKLVQSGETADVVIIPQPGMQTFEKSGKVVAGRVRVLARSGMVVAVRKGAPKPDISSPEALKRTLLAARSITYGRGAGSEHFEKVLERLGIANDVKPKIVRGEPGDTGVRVANGEAEIGVTLLPVLVPVAGIEIVGPLPGDLQILLRVAKLGSMAEAAAQLSTTQPTVSQAIADLEDAVGVRLFDRSTRGVVPTPYGEILLKSGREAFDALKQGLRAIEYLATPGAGEIWIGCAELSLYGFVPDILQRLADRYPKIVVHAATANPAEGSYSSLRERKLDLMIGRAATPLPEDIEVEHLYEEDFCVVTAAHSPWARPRKVELAELMNESWIFGEATNTTQALISAVFQSKGLGLPPISVYTVSMNLRLGLLASGRYISCIPRSTFRYGSQGRLKALPLDMNLKLPISLVKLKSRTHSPVVQVFIEQAREAAKAIEKQT